MPSEKLKPCPFCGNDGSGPIEDALHIIHNEPDYVHEHRHTWSVQCDKCTATMGYSDSEDEAVEAWNTRALTAAEQADPALATRSGAVKAEAAREALRELATVQMNLSIEDWCRISNTILAALEPAQPAPAAEAVACVERGSKQSTPQPESRLREARLREALDRYEAAANHVGGCGDGNCVVVRPIGQHTNGGCRCYTDKMKAQRMMRAGQMLCTAIRAALNEANDERA